MSAIQYSGLKMTIHKLFLYCRKRKLQVVEDNMDEHEVALVLASQQQKPRTSDKRELKKGKIFEKHDAPISTFNAQQKDGKLRLPNKVHRSHSAPEVHDTTPTPQVIGEGTVAAFKMPNGSMILLDEHTQFLHTDDMIKLGSLVPGCEPIIECPKSVVYKGKTCLQLHQLIMLFV